MTLSKEFIAADEGARDNPAMEGYRDGPVREGFGNGLRAETVGIIIRPDADCDGKGLTIGPDPIII